MCGGTGILPSLKTILSETLMTFGIALETYPLGALLRQQRRIAHPLHLCQQRVTHFVGEQQRE